MGEKWRKVDDEEDDDEIRETVHIEPKRERIEIRICGECSTNPTSIILTTKYAIAQSIDQSGCRPLAIRFFSASLRSAPSLAIVAFSDLPSSQVSRSLAIWGWNNSSRTSLKESKKSLQALIAAAFRNENECLRIVEENNDINTNEKRKKMTTTKEKRKEVRIDESDFFNLLNDIQKGKDAPNDKGMEVRVPKDKEDEARITKDKREKMRISKEKRKEVRIDESDFFNLLNDINLGEDLSNRKKKGRGPTKLLGANIIGGENPRLKVEWNERGQPVGKNSEKFVSLLGVLAKEMVPLNKPSWTKVNMGIKNTIWLLLLVSLTYIIFLFLPKYMSYTCNFFLFCLILKQKCIIEECRKKIVFRLIGKLWRNWKSMLSRKLKKAVSPSACKPLEVKEHEWNEFVQVRSHLNGK
ncbi:hypothetical protein Sjap_021270 [Stephania japonica]|uniref:Uncharacterized protein n=1 Tax=Stephania japonica TaxID=461633 RepID=A0AAP0HNW0_9MAGN